MRLNKKTRLQAVQPPKNQVARRRLRVSRGPAPHIDMPQSFIPFVWPF